MGSSSYFLAVRVWTAEQSTHLCFSCLASTEARTSISGHAAQQRSGSSSEDCHWSRPSPPLSPPRNTLPFINATAFLPPDHGRPMLGWWLPSTGWKGLQLVSEVTYGIFCYSSAGSALVLHICTLRPI